MFKCNDSSTISAWDRDLPIEDRDLGSARLSDAEARIITIGDYLATKLMPARQFT